MITYEALWRRLKGYDAGEAKAIVRLVLEVRFHLTTADVYLGKVSELSANHREELEKMMLRLEQMEPVQYVLGEADFCGRPFIVDRRVLIPRPETEELVDFIGESATAPAMHMLDIGTGSGCIAVTLALRHADATVVAWDVSSDALDVARENARRLGARVAFEQRNALSLEAEAPQWDVIVSNPPYIGHDEKPQMEQNVLAYEPHQALFADDPLQFYRAIARYAASALRPCGQLFFEINPRYDEALTGMLHELAFDVELRNDRYGRRRMLKATRPRNHTA